MKWTIGEQSIWGCIMAGLTGLKRLGWLDLGEYEDIINRLQSYIDEKIGVL